MALVSLLTLRNRVRNRADQENSQFVSDARLNELINSAADELYDILLQKFGEDYRYAEQVVTFVVGQETYSLPADFLRARGVESSFAGVKYLLRRADIRQRTMLRNAQIQQPIRYQIEGGNLRLLPAPAISGSATLFYVPSRPQLVNDADTLDGVEGWEEYVVVTAAIACLDKEESDSVALRADQTRLLNRIESAAERRNQGEPARVVDVSEEINPLFGATFLWP